MPFTAERVPNEPIVVFTYTGVLDLPLFQQALDMNAKFIAEVGGPIYIIVDVRNMQTNFMDMLRIMQETQQQRPGAATDPNIKQLFFVGGDALVRMFQDNITRKNLPMHLAMFPSVEDAVESARVQAKISANQAQAIPAATPPTPPPASESGTTPTKPTA